MSALTNPIGDMLPVHAVEGWRWRLWQWLPDRWQNVVRDLALRDMFACQCARFHGERGANLMAQLAVDPDEAKRFYKLSTQWAVARFLLWRDRMMLADFFSERVGPPYVY